MPITIPPFDQYQAPVFPLRGLWNNKPAEGDKLALFEVDWLKTTTNRAVQFQLGGNSPVAISQIVALAIDNRRSGYDVDFVFPDSGYTLTAPAYNQGVFPVFTNALMFYVIASDGVVAGNRTTFWVCNSMPPPVALNPTAMQTSDAVAAVELNTGVTQQLIDPSISGTLNGFVITVAFNTGMSVGLELVDGTGTTLWADSVVGSQGSTQVVNISGLHIRFVNGVKLVVLNPTVQNQATASVNLFYTTP